MTAPQEKNAPSVRSFSPSQSLRARMLAAISFSVFLVIGGLIWLGAIRIREMSSRQIEHEGILLSNTLEAALEGPAAQGDRANIQAYIDALVSKRDRNDLEINVLLLREKGSEVVASNVPDNIEEADDEEDVATRAALASREPQLIMETEDGPEDADSLDDEEGSEDAESAERAHDPLHPDFYFPTGSRLLSVTTPLVHAGADLGSINIKLSLAYLDEELARLQRSAAIAVGLGCLILACLLTPFLNRKVFRPLKRLATEMYAFGMGEEIGELAPTTRRDEIGVLENEFFSMVARINSAEAMRKELEQVRAEREKHEIQEKLRQAQKMEALGTLAGGIAHDFNNILTPILGYTEIVMQRLRGEGDSREYLGYVVNAGHRAHELVRQILAFSRKSNEEKVPLRLGTVVRETLKLLRASIPANVEIREQIADNGALVRGNPTQIHQIVLNLATNACHAMLEQGGRLDVTLREMTLEVDTDMDHAQRLASGHYLRLTVADTGHGIRPDVIERIFEPYFTTKKEGEGTGLGLAMVHGIVQEMGGAISVQTEVGKGTRFDVYLPVVIETPPAADGNVSEELPAGTERVLIVDDEKPIADMIGVHLKSLGYRCAIFTNPLEAVERATAGPDHFDLVISDVAMPGLTGVEFARKLAERGANIPIILCSGYAGGINWRTAGAVGIKAMVTKPIVKEKLAQTVRKVLDASALAVSL